MKVKELAEEYREIHEELKKACFKAFKQCQNAGIIPHPAFDEEDDPGLERPTKEFDYYGYELRSENIRIKGKKYIGGGEYYYCYIDVPYDAFENLDAFIAERQEHYRQIRVAKIARLRKQAEERQQEQADQERKTYEELKAKFEPAKDH